MKLVCPSCGAIHSSEAWQSDADARQCLRIVAELPTEISRRALPYLALFRPGSGRGLTWGKALRLLGELKILSSESTIQWDRNPARPNRVMAWANAMERMIQNPPRRLPLTSHGYLRKIAYELADDMDREVEVAHNKAERDGILRSEERKMKDGGGGERDLEPILSVEKMKKIREENMRKYKNP